MKHPHAGKEKPFWEKRWKTLGSIVEERMNRMDCRIFWLLVCLFQFFLHLLQFGSFIHSQLKCGLKAALVLAAKGSTISLESRNMCWSLAEKPLLQCIQVLIQNVGYKAGRAAMSSLSDHHSDEVTSLISLQVNIHFSLQPFWAQMTLSKIFPKLLRSYLA